MRTGENLAREGYPGGAPCNGAPMAPGQPWTADHIIESQRLLRDLEYIEPSVIGSRLVGDSVDVLVVTHDQWTTQPELNLERGGGRTFGSAGFTERNLLGLGLGVSLSFRNEPTGRTRTAVMNGRRLFGSQLEGQAPYERHDL